MLISLQSFSVEQVKITIKSENISYKEAFVNIKQQSGKIIIYSDEDFDYDKKISLNFQNKSLQKALNIVLEKTPLISTIEKDYVIIHKRSRKAQEIKKERIISGVITSERGETLPGVNIKIKGTSLGTASNQDGKFEITTNIGDYLVFSFIGYKTQEVRIGTDKTLTIILKEDCIVLDQIIISGVASGTERKKMSVSVAKITTSDLVQVPQSSISSSLQGKLAGVTVTSGSGTPGSGSSITLRGATSLTGNQAPMILVDGMIMQGSLSDINVDDVESIEVVKGAAASALYGSKAGNGVVVVTSKRGARLKSNTTKITIRNEVGIQKVENTIDMAKYHPYLLANDWQTVDTYTKYASVTYPDNYVTGYNSEIEGNRILLPTRMMTQPYRVNNDIQKEMFDNGINYTNFVNVASKLDRTNIYMSFENHNSEGVLKETGGYERQSFRLNVDHAITPKIKIKASNNFILTENDMPGGGNNAFAQVVMMEPDVDLKRANDDGTPYNFAPNHWNQIVFNPLYELYNRSNKLEKTRFLANYELNWILTDWMTFKSSYGVESQDYRKKILTPKGMYTGIDTDGFIESPGYLDNYSSKILNENIRATLSFFKTWNELDFNARVSYLFEDSHFESAGGYGRGFDFEDFPSFVIIPDENSYFRTRVEDIKAENVFAIASFTFKDRYILDGLFRNDGSSLFGKDERRHNYYRISGAYRISEDIKIPGVKELKLRGAIGGSGQRPSFEMQYETYKKVAGVYEKNTLGNRELKPSQSQEIELGMDVSFLKRFYLEATYSKTTTSEQFLKVPLLVNQYGFAYQWRNAGELETKTFEAMLQANIIKTDNLQWDMRFTFDKTSSKITKLDFPEYRTGPQSSFYIKEGEAYGIMYGRKFVRSIQQMREQLSENDNISNYKLNSEGYVIRANSQGTKNETPILVKDKNGNPVTEKIGDINPDFRMGISSDLAYKNFNFHMLWKWKQGGDLYNSTAQKMVNHNRHPIMDQYGKAPEKMKTIDYYLGFYDSQSINEFWVEDGTYLRLAEASINYTFTKDNLGKLGQYVNGIKLGIIGKNLLTFTNYSGYDPEVTSSGYAFDNNGYPNFTTYSFSVGIEF
ncbi:MAG: SusC/RagA family TonB-linked outer membrane protein [Bacteroidales bacterium]|nr:SusC/RagA family TonB-linked outer membrane protein [Bacteroidales bacterium]